MKRFLAVALVIVFILGMVTVAFATKALTPSTDSKWDIGTTKLKYKDIIISGDVTSNSVKVIDSGAIAGSALANDSVTSAKIAIANVATSDLADSSVTSDKIAIANVQASDMFLNTVTVTVAAGQIGSSTVVESGSLLIGWLNISGVSNSYIFNSVSYVGGNLLTNTSVHLGSMIGNAIFIRP